VHQLRGEFAFVLWDSRAQRLVAGRDRFGIKPLYFAQHGNALYFASEAKALFAAGVPAAWDQESFYQSLHTGVPLPSRSLFRGISPVPPGHLLVARSASEFRLIRYWDFDYPRAEATAPGTREAGEAISAFRDLFDEAVRLRLRADVPVGVYLSGGLDSCAILGTAAKMRGTGIKAFNLSFDSEAYDEDAIAREMAEHAGADYHSVKVTRRALADHFIASMRHGETLVSNSHGVAKYMLSKVVRDAGFKVVLTGEGSDEILAGYPHFRRDLLLNSNDHGQGANVEAALAELMEKNALSRGILLIDDKGGSGTFGHKVQARIGKIPTYLEGLMNSSVGYAALLNQRTQEKFAGFNPYEWFLNDLDIHGQVTGRHPINQSLYLWSKSLLPQYLLTILGDRMEMGHSVEGRVPFLDHHLVEFATKLPIDLKIRDMKEKYILREAARPVLTRTVYERQKHPFVAPPSAHAEVDPFFTFLRDYIGDHRKDLCFFDSKKVEGLLATMEHMNESERQSADPTLLYVASAIALQEEFGLGS